ncbi:HNH endonuclease [Streptomyces sp. NPDC001156]
MFCGGPHEHDEHTQPLGKGGEHSRANLLPPCAGCNLSKGAADPVE